MKRLYRNLLVVGAVAAAGVAFGETRHSQPAFETRLEHVWASDPALSGMYDALKTGFPTEWARFRTEIGELARRGGTQKEAEAAASQFMANLIKAHILEAAHAPSLRLSEYRRQSQSLMHAAAIDPYVCGQVAAGTFQFTGNPPQAVIYYLGKSSEALLRAAADGKRNPVARDTANLSDGDAESFKLAMKRAGATDDDLSVFGDERRFMAASDEQLCRIGLAQYDGLNSLPREQADRVTAVMIVVTRS